MTIDYKILNFFVIQQTIFFFFEREIESAHKSWFDYRKSLTKYVNSNHLAFLKQMSPQHQNSKHLDVG